MESECGSIKITCLLYSYFKTLHLILTGHKDLIEQFNTATSLLVSQFTWFKWHKIPVKSTLVKNSKTLKSYLPETVVMPIETWGCCIAEEAEQDEEEIEEGTEAAAATAEAMEAAEAACTAAVAACAAAAAVGGLWCWWWWWCCILLDLTLEVGEVTTVKGTIHILCIHILLHLWQTPYTLIKCTYNQDNYTGLPFGKTLTNFSFNCSSYR